MTEKMLHPRPGRSISPLFPSERGIFFTTSKNLRHLWPNFNKMSVDFLPRTCHNVGYIRHGLNHNVQLRRSISVMNESFTVEKRTSGRSPARRAETQTALQWLNTPEHRHIKLLFYWPLFGLIFLLLERFRPGQVYYAVHCRLDDLIPFCQWALIPYLFWFVFLIGALAYTFFRDVPAFRKMMYFVIVTYTIALLMYILFPTCQYLRPASFVRDNVLTRITAWFYRFDTNTDVCPSLHVIGSMAAMFALWDCKRFQGRGWKLAYALMALSISLSTVFMKQHSVVDIGAAAAVSAVGWFFSYGRGVRVFEPELIPVKE